MSDWKEYTLGDISRNISRRFDFNAYPNVVFINTGDVLNNQFLHCDISNVKDLPGQAKKAIKKGDILYSEIRPGNGRYLFVDNDLDNYVVSTKFMVIEPNANIVLPEFLFLLLISNETTEYFKMIAESRSGTFPQITFDSVSSLSLNIPDKETQQKILDIITPLDDKIELNTQINQTLEQIAQALFKSWFVDFDPVRAKVQALSDGLCLEQAELAAMQAISGKTPEELTALSQTQPERYAELAETAKAFPCEMVEVDGVEVPKGWEIKPFGSLLENTIGGDWGKEEEDEKHTENVFVFRGTDLPNVQKNEFDAIPKRYIAKNKLNSRNAKYGDIIIEVSGGSKNQPTGRSLLITKNLLCNFDLPIIPASFCRLFTPINEQIAVLMACHLKMIYTQGKTWEYQVQSTGISNFQTTNFLENELLVIPDENILNAFYEKVGVIFEKMASSENMLLSKTRDLLLPRLLNGEI